MSFFKYSCNWLLNVSDYPYLVSRAAQQDKSYTVVQRGMIVIYFTWPPTMHTGNFLRHCRIGMFFSKPYKKGLEMVKHNIEV